MQGWEDVMIDDKKPGQHYKGVRMATAEVAMEATRFALSTLDKSLPKSLMVRLDGVVRQESYAR